MDGMGREALATAYESKEDTETFKNSYIFWRSRDKKAKIDKNACDLLHGHRFHRPENKGCHTCDADTSIRV